VYVPVSKKTLFLSVAPIKDNADQVTNDLGISVCGSRHSAKASCHGLFKILANLIPCSCYTVTVTLLSLFRISAILLWSDSRAFCIAFRVNSLILTVVAKS